ncbi:unnamed protein product [Vitrella brassicaformis CCMP3155]|uniref:Uncharacterized protein n=2 Tax=Vitrella brassicaformis TaxID=1169539 RepID=A0A0G4GZZ7_VITBC|nr:unnamed protein product [Vitrella brassicaformis CCMP3155]|eukprot:CEM36867.1 unnamed protein product [Vitrella brassicaformis CCMP3155]
MGGFTFNTKGLWQKESYKGMGKDILIGSAGSMVIFGCGDVLAQLLEMQQKERPALIHPPHSGMQSAHHHAHDNGRPSLATHTMPASGLDTQRLVVVASQGWILNGVMLTPFYRVLDILIGDTMSGKFFPRIPMKIFLTMVLYMPASTMMFFFLTPCLEVLAEAATTATQQQDQHHEGEESLMHRLQQSFAKGCEEGWTGVSRHFAQTYALAWLIWPLTDSINFRFIPLTYRPLWDSLIDIVWTTILSRASHSEPNGGQTAMPPSSSPSHFDVPLYRSPDAKIDGRLKSLSEVLSGLDPELAPEQLRPPPRHPPPDEREVVLADLVHISDPAEVEFDPREVPRGSMTRGGRLECVGEGLRCPLEVHQRWVDNVPADGDGDSDDADVHGGQGKKGGE